MVHSEIVYDARWEGPHGIGRFAREVSRRLPLSLTLMTGAHPVSARGLVESEIRPHVVADKEREQVYFSPGYTPCLTWRGHHVFTVHDLIHLDVPAEGSRVKSMYYDMVVKQAVRHSGAVLTVSEFSRRRIAEWANVDPSTITVVGNGVDETFAPEGPRRDTGWPYLLHVGNTKPHKNLARLVQALARVPDVHLVLSSSTDGELVERAQAAGVKDRLHFLHGIPEEDLANWYRGATAVVIPSLYEGFGLPALEGMACGVPVVASRTTALGEVVADAAVLVEPTDVDSLVEGISTAVTDEAERARLRAAGPERARHFHWDVVADGVAQALRPSRSGL